MRWAWSLVFALQADASMLPLKHLPGVSPKALGTNHFGGYLDVDYKGLPLKVFCFLAQHEDPSAPLIAWMNGGPGASSMLGTFGELGPFLLNGRSVPKTADEEWHLFENPHGWNRLGSLLAWEQPAGVGFSRCPAGQESCPVWDDTNSAEANLQVLKAFYQEFHSEAQRPFVIAGESYGGIYVPLLAQQVVLHNQAISDASDKIPLRGIAVGNGCTGYGVNGSCGADTMEVTIEYYETGMPGANKELLAGIRKACAGELSAALQSASSFSRPCRAAMRVFYHDIGPYNVYNWGSSCGQDTGNWGDGEAYACGAQAAMGRYFSELPTQQALHVVSESSTKPLDWTMWDGDAPFYNISLPSVLPVYDSLLTSGLQMLIYNGLRDTAVPVTGAEKWTASMGGRVVEARRKWTSERNSSAASGHVASYERGLTFATIEGAGHLVPADRPEAALAMMAAWLSEKPLPKVVEETCAGIWLGRGWGDFCADHETEDEIKV